MSASTRKRRRKLAAHDRGINRHDPAYSYEQKAARRAIEYQTERSTRAPRAQNASDD